MATAVSYLEINSPIGILTLSATEAGVCGMEFGPAAEAGLSLHRYAEERRAQIDPGAHSGLLQEAAGQLKDYFNGSLQTFSLPLDVKGTPFQESVWQALTRIPYGEVRSYKDVAEAIGNPKAVRAVGGANNRNPLPIIVPCHRVIGAGGDMVGYGGGLPIKRFLLQHEGYLVHKAE